MSKELEAKDLQANFITCFKELLTKTDKNIIVVNISREMAQDMVNLYEKYLTINPSEALKELDYIGKNCYEEAGNAEEDCILYAKDYIGFNTIKQSLLKAQDNEKMLDDMLGFNDGSLTSCFEYKGKQVVAMLLDAYDEFMEQEKALEIIFEKGLSLAERDMIKHSENYEQYCIKFGWCYMKNAGSQKTEEEFNLLKRWLNGNISSNNSNN